MDAAEVSAYLAAILNKGIQSRGHAALALPGGSSPVPVFETLRDEAGLDWGKVTVTLVDDRAVAPDHPDSNHGLIMAHMLSDGAPAAAARFIPLHDNPGAGGMIPMPLDAILLGMGGDGHFASLFPTMIDDATAFSPEAGPEIITTGIQGSPAHPRVTMNLAMICAAANIALVLPDAGKKAIFEDAKTDRTLPIHHLIAALGDRLRVFG